MNDNCTLLDVSAFLISYCFFLSFSNLFAFRILLFVGRSQPLQFNSLLCKSLVVSFSRHNSLIHLVNKMKRAQFKWHAHNFERQEDFIANHNVPYQNRSNDYSTDKVTPEVAIFGEFICFSSRQAKVPHDDSCVQERY